MHRKTIAVIGSNSFSGASFIKSLLKENNSYKIIGISRQEEISKPYLPYISNENFAFYQLDMNIDYPKIADLCEKFKVSTIVNFAAQSMVAESWELPWQWYETNLVSISKFIFELTRKNKIERFIQFTTPEVYGSTNGWIKENFHFNPTTPYAISRAAGDLHLKALFDTAGFPVIFTRAANVFGEHQRCYRIIPKTILYGLTGKKIPLHGGGLSERSFIHIDDVSSALIKIMYSGQIGETYHISTTRVEEIRRIVEICAEKLGKDLNQICEVSGDRIGKDQAYKLDSSKLRKDLGWSDQISLEIGIERTLKWIQNDLKSINSRSLEYIHKE